MTAQVVHEAEYTRQHARYRIPARFDIGTQQFPVNEWSVSGLSLNEFPREMWFQGILKGRLVFGFGEVETSVEIEMELMHRDETRAMTGYRYINLGRAQLATIHHVINAALSGDIVDAGDVIEIIKRDAFTVKNTPKTMDEEGTPASKIMARIRRFMAFFVFLGIVAGLLTFIGYTAYNRLFVIESVSARVDAPVVVIRAPQPSYFQPLSVPIGRELKSDDLVATMKLVGGGSTSIASPCHCRVISHHILDRQFVGQGEALLTLLPVGERLFIVAKFDFEQVSKLSIGQSALIQLPTGTQLTGTVREVRSVESIEHRHVARLKSIAASPITYADVIIEPAQSLDTDLLGYVASVRIDTYSSR